jgi:hypothetical protein
MEGICFEGKCLWISCSRTGSDVTEEEELLLYRKTDVSKQNGVITSRQYCSVSVARHCLRYWIVNGEDPEGIFKKGAMALRVRASSEQKVNIRKFLLHVSLGYVILSCIYFV